MHSLNLCREVVRKAALLFGMRRVASSTNLVASGRAGYPARVREASGWAFVCMGSPGAGFLLPGEQLVPATVTGNAPGSMDR